MAYGFRSYRRRARIIRPFPLRSLFRGKARKGSYTRFSRAKRSAQGKCRSFVARNGIALAASAKEMGQDNVTQRVFVRVGPKQVLVQMPGRQDTSYRFVQKSFYKGSLTLIKNWVKANLKKGYGRPTYFGKDAQETERMVEAALG